MRSDWHRQRGEPNRAHALFEQYLELGPGRSLPALARTGAASHSYLKKLSARWHWKDRSASWQMSVHQAGQVDDAELVAQTRERQMRDAQMLMQLARSQLAKWVARDGGGVVHLLRGLTPHQAARFWQTGYRLESELLPVPQAGSQSQPRPAGDADAGSTSSPAEDRLVLKEEIATILRVLRKGGVSKAGVVRYHAQLLRWLWLPEERSLSLDAINKAIKRQRRRERAKERAERAFWKEAMAPPA